MNSETNPNANSNSSANTLRHQRNRSPTDPLTDERQVQQQNESPETSRAAEVTGMEDTSSHLDSSPIRFNPTDKELISDYLSKKIKNEDLPNNKIGDVDVFKYHPKTIIENHPQSEEGKWYFFSPINRNHARQGGAFGHWYVKGSKKKISDDNGATIGERSCLHFHERDQTKTDLRMQKYILSSHQRKLLGEPAIKLDDYMLCKIYIKKSEQGDQVSMASSKNEDLPHCDFKHDEDPVFVQFERERQKLQLPDLNDPVLPSNQVANLGNLQFQNNIAVQNPVVWPPAPPLVIHPSPAHVDRFYHSLNYNPQGIQMTPPPYDHVDDDFVFPELSEFPDLDFFDDDVNDGSNLG